MKMKDTILTTFQNLGRKVASIKASDAWDVDVTFATDMRIRNLRDGDLPLLFEFMEGLEPAARDLFAPYPWNEPNKLAPAFQNAIKNSVTHVDAMYLLLHAGKAVGHFFLWKAGGNPHSRAHGVDLPELGIALAQGYRKQGLGMLAVNFLLAAAKSLDADGVELTTAFINESGWETYRRCGFEHVGDIECALDVDVTATFTGEVVANRYRLERQMVHVLDPEKHELILNYLAVKREQAAAHRKS